MYVLDHNHPAELSHERLAKELRTPRREGGPTSERPAWSPRRAVALWGRTGIPFFRA